MNTQRKSVRLIPLMIGIALFMVLGAIVWESVQTLREGVFRRIVVGSYLRQVGQTALIYASDRNGDLPATNLNAKGIPEEGEQTTVHRYAVALAHGGGLNDLSIWVLWHKDDHPKTLRRDPPPEGWRRFVSRRKGTDQVRTVIVRERPGEWAANPHFKESAISWQVVGGLTTDLPATTPLAFTRGLGFDGRWDPTDPFMKGSGGHVVFLGGNVRFSSTEAPEERMEFEKPDGSRTHDIRKVLLPEHEIYRYPDTPIPNQTRGVGEFPTSRP